MSTRKTHKDRDLLKVVCMDKFDKESVIPYYYQIKTIIRNKIIDGKYKKEGPLPSENELSEEYDVSRNTIRMALRELVVNEGLIVSRKGEGYFVAKPKLEQNLFRFYNFAKDFSKGQNSVVSNVIKKEVVTAPKYIAKKLDVLVNSPIHKIVRVRIYNGEPLVYETSYISVKKFNFNDFTDADLTHGCIYDILRNFMI